VMTAGTNLLRTLAKISVPVFVKARSTMPMQMVLPNLGLKVPLRICHHKNCTHIKPPQNCK